MARAFEIVVALFLLSASAFARPAELKLTPSGAPRELPARILGASAEPFWKADKLLMDPARAGQVKSLHIAYTRFPGGSQSNYYDWKTGLFDVEANGNDSAYYRRFVDLSKWVKQAMPDGVTLERYKSFSDAAGADIILVPNLETSTVDDQIAWFRHLAAEGDVPSRIEMGNEFWIAMGMDQTVLEKWPDEPSSMKVIRQYADAIRPYLPPGAEIAVQAAAPIFGGGGKRRVARLREWNEALRPEPWFDAVTLHLYPRLNEILGDPDAVSEPLTPDIASRNFNALMARVDQGTDDTIEDVSARVPGKAIWVTEWNPAGGAGFGDEKSQSEPASPAMMMQLVTRMTLALLRHPQVAISEYFSLRFSPRTSKCAFLPGPDGGEEPTPVAMALRWLDEAANGGVSFRRYVEPGGARVSGGGVRAESYAQIEAGLFRGKGRATLIVQNASAASRVWIVDPALAPGAPSLIQQMSMPDLADTALRPARVVTIPASGEIPIAPYSVTRIVWKN